MDGGRPGNLQKYNNGSKNLEGGIYIYNTLPFLDVMLSIKNNELHPDIYAKDTDTFNYLPFSSSHPRHVTRNIPFTLAKRIRGIVSEEITAKKRIEQMRSRLLIKKYPKRVINMGIKKAFKLSREEIVDPSKDCTSNNNELNINSIYFVSTFNERSVLPTMAIKNAVSHFNNHSKLSRKNKLQIKSSYIENLLASRICMLGIVRFSTMVSQRSYTVVT